MFKKPVLLGLVFSLCFVLTGCASDYERRGRMIDNMTKEEKDAYYDAMQRGYDANVRRRAQRKKEQKNNPVPTKPSYSTISDQWSPLPGTTRYSPSYPTTTYSVPAPNPLGSQQSTNGETGVWRCETDGNGACTNDESNPKFILIII